MYPTLNTGIREEHSPMQLAAIEQLKLPTVPRALTDASNPYGHNVPLPGVQPIMPAPAVTPNTQQHVTPTGTTVTPTPVAAPTATPTPAPTPMPTSTSTIKTNFTQPSLGTSQLHPTSGGNQQY
jgi:hypothetical protein